MADPAALNPAARPLVIAHRGASGYVPEHTLSAYFLAIEQGADYIEPDLVMTRDGVLVARHENEIGATTDVARHREFADRKCAKVIDGVPVEGWFTEDFTLAELRTLRVRERIARLRPANARFDGQFTIATLDEVLALVRALEQQRRRTLAQPAAARRRGADGAGRVSPASRRRIDPAAGGRRIGPAGAGHVGRAGEPRIGIYPETKHPGYFAALGLAMERPLLRTLRRWGYAGGGAPVFLQSFETSNLRALRRMTRLPLVQLIGASGAPADRVARGDPLTYADLVRPAGLAEVARYAAAIGVDKTLVIGRRADEALQDAPTCLVADAHARGLRVHAWTFRAENHFLPARLRVGDAPDGRGDLAGELAAYLAAGIDGFFTDQPDVGVAARDAYAR